MKKIIADASRPLKLEKEVASNSVKIGTSITSAGSAKNSQVKIRRLLKATYLVADDGKIYKLSDVVTALSNLSLTLPTYE